MEQGGSRYDSFSSSECSRIWTFLLWYIILIFYWNWKERKSILKLSKGTCVSSPSTLFFFFSFFWSFHSMACDMLGAQAWGLLGDRRSPPCKKCGWLYLREKGICLFFFFFFISSWKKKIMIFVIILAMNCLLWSHSKQTILELAVVSM